MDSPANKAELAKLHRIEQTRIPALVAAAKADEDEEDMSACKTMLGRLHSGSAAVGGRTGHASDLRKEQGAAGGTLETAFARPRPYQTDNTLHPSCALALTEAPNSYPTGQALTGHFEALTLASFPRSEPSRLESGVSGRLCA